MTVTRTTSYSGPYAPDGVTTAFPFGFTVLDASDVQAVRLSAAGVQTILGGYSVTLSPDNGGTVNFTVAPAAGDPLYLLLDPSFEQQANFATQGAFSPTAINNALDRGAMRDLFLLSAIDRAPLAPIGETLGPIPPQTVRANTVMGFDFAGNPEVLSPSSLLGTKGDPGGNAAAIGLFTGANTLNIQTGTDAVRTSGYSSAGIGIADYIDDAAVDSTYVTAHPKTSFISANGRGFRLALSQTIRVEHFGAIGDGTTDDAAAFNAALTTANALGIGTVEGTPGKTYKTTSTITLKSNVRLKNVAITSTASTVFTDTSGTDGHGLENVSAVQTGSSDASILFDFNGTNAKLLSTNFSKSPAAGGFIGYFRATTSGFRIFDYTCSGANGMFLEGHDHKIELFDITAAADGDDGWVIKGAICQTYNIAIANGIARNYAAAVSFGSEVGQGGANDSSYQYFIRNVSVANVIAENCTAFTYIKPGAIAADYRDGTVQDVTFTNCQLRDLTGAVARRFAQISAGRGARVWDIRFHNCIARFRCPNRFSGTNAGFWIAGVDYPGGTATTEIDGIFVNGISIVDPFGGVANGVGGAPGYPIDNAIAVDNSTGNGGTAPIIKRVEINDLYSDGAARNAIDITGNVATSVGPFRFRHPVLKNYAAESLTSADNSAIAADAVKVEVEHLEAIPSASAPAGTRGVMADLAANKTIEIIDADGAIHLPIGDVAAATTVHRSFVATRDLWIRKIEFVNRATVAADATNKITLTVDNKDTAANLTTKDSNTGFAVVANTSVSINGTSQFSGANAYLSKGKSLDITIAAGGTAALAGASLIIHVVRYGQP